MQNCQQTAEILALKERALDVLYNNNNYYNNNYSNKMHTVF